MSTGDQIDAFLNFDEDSQQDMNNSSIQVFNNFITGFFAQQKNEIRRTLLQQIDQIVDGMMGQISQRLSQQIASGNCPFRIVPPRDDSMRSGNYFDLEQSNAEPVQQPILNTTANSSDPPEQIESSSHSNELPQQQELPLSSSVSDSEQFPLFVQIKKEEDEEDDIVMLGQYPSTSSVTNNSNAEELSGKSDSMSNSQESIEEMTNSDSDAEECDCAECTGISGVFELKEEQNEDSVPNEIPLVQKVKRQKTTTTNDTSMLASTSSKDASNEVTNSQGSLVALNSNSCMIKTLKLNCCINGCNVVLPDVAQFDKHLLLQHRTYPHRCLLTGCHQSFYTR